MAVAAGDNQILTTLQKLNHLMIEKIEELSLLLIIIKNSTLKIVNLRSGRILLLI